MAAKAQAVPPDPAPATPGIPEHALLGPEALAALLYKGLRTPAAERAAAATRVIEVAVGSGLKGPAQHALLRALRGVVSGIDDPAGALALASDLEVAVSARAFGASGPAAQIALLDALRGTAVGDPVRAGLLAAIACECFGTLAPSDALQVVQLIEGPKASDDKRLLRGKAMQEIWTAHRRLVVERVLAAAQLAEPPSGQGEAVVELLQAPCCVVRIWESQRARAHTFVEVGLKSTGPVGSYGAWLVALSPGRSWARVASPDPISIRGWPADGPYARETYDKRLVATTLHQQLTLIEAIERSFDVNATKPDADAIRERHSGRKGLGFRSVLHNFLHAIEASTPRGERGPPAPNPPPGQ